MKSGWDDNDADGNRTVKLTMISGSLRKDSANSAALRAASVHVTSAGLPVEIEWCAIRDLPMFDEDVEATGWPGPVARIRQQVENADAILICTPEYNGSVPGVLKNAIDWLSRPDSASPLVGKPVATMSASSAGFGAVWAQENLRFVLEQCQAVLINDDLVAIPLALDALDSHGELTDPAELTKVHALCNTIFDRWRSSFTSQAATA